jgi:hypothetical protein
MAVVIKIQVASIPTHRFTDIFQPFRWVGQEFSYLTKGITIYYEFHLWKVSRQPTLQLPTHYKQIVSMTSNNRGSDFLIERSSLNVF